MTRFSIALVAIASFTFGACQRHPLSADPNDTMITHTHGSNGGSEEHEEKKAEAAGEAGAPKAAEEGKKDEVKKEPAAEEKPAFFPEKK